MSSGITDYKGTKSSFSSGGLIAPSPKGRLLGRAEPTTDYTINMSVVRRSTATTIASGNCIGSVLEYHIHKSAETERFACRPINNKGSWHATMWLMINHGQGNLGTYGYCC